MSSHIHLKRELLTSRILRRDASGEFGEVNIPLEIRFDPLTGRSCRIVNYSLSRITRPDITSLVERSQKITCPFCPPLIDKITPRFPAEIVPAGIIREGKARVVPNNAPYDTYGAVVVISDRHFIPMDDLDMDTLLPAFLVGQSYIQLVHKAYPRARYHFIAWNYLFPAGSSLMHPHLQCNIGYFPSTYQRQILEASQDYYNRHRANFWTDLIEQEQQTGQRYIGGIGNTRWLTRFAPRGRLSDILAVFPERVSVMDFSREDWQDLIRGLFKVFQFLNKFNILSFNLSTYSGFDDNQFCAHVVVIPRSQLMYTSIETSDQFYYQMLHDENMCILSPEFACQELRKLFNGENGG
jgi:galactose-1-phosphate uridylyltransferase